MRIPIITSVHCPDCNALNTAGAYFCAHCGKQMRSAFERAEGPVKLGQAPELSAPLATVPREATKPANLSSERPADYAPPDLGGTGWQAPATSAAYVSPLRASPPESPAAVELSHSPDPAMPPETRRILAEEEGQAIVEQAGDENDAAEALAAAESEDALLKLIGRVPPGATPFRQGMWTRPATGMRPAPTSEAEAEPPGPAATLPAAAAIWNIGIGELIGAARDRAEKLRIGMAPTALPSYDEQQANTSGLGRGQPLPQAARGFSLGGLVPGGLYAFAYKNPVLGFIGLGLLFFKWYPLYVVYIGVVGRQMAWQNRRFEDIAHYNRVMRQWDIAGFYMLPLYLVWWIGVLVYKNL